MEERDSAVQISIGDLDRDVVDPGYDTRGVLAQSVRGQGPKSNVLAHHSGYPVALNTSALLVLNRLSRVDRQFSSTYTYQWIENATEKLNTHVEELWIMCIWSRSEVSIVQGLRMGIPASGSIWLAKGRLVSSQDFGTRDFCFCFQLQQCFRLITPAFRGRCQSNAWECKIPDFRAMIPSYMIGEILQLEWSAHCFQTHEGSAVAKYHEGDAQVQFEHAFIKLRDGKTWSCEVHQYYPLSR